MKAAHPDQFDSFGGSLALSADGTWLVVGAEQEASIATGIDGDQSNNAASGAGAAYVFTRNGAALIQQAYLKASNTDVNDLFGTSIAISGDGFTVAVGARSESSASAGINGNQADNSAVGAGAVYVFKRSGATWLQEAYVKASNPEILDSFGTSLALSADGSVLAVGAVDESSSATGVNGIQTDNGAPRSGAVYVFTRTTSWAQTAYVKASNTGSLDQFGSAIALSADGATLAVGAHTEDSSSTGIDGIQANDTASNAGAVYVFGQSGASWTQLAYIKASNTDADDVFGTSVALAADGATLAVGAPGEDSSATGIGGDQLNGSASAAGAVYLYTRTGASWVQQAYIKASNTDANDQFGQRVALSETGAGLAVGADGEASSASGIDGDQLDNSAAAAGAAYLFSGPAWTQTSYVKASNPGNRDEFGWSLAMASQSSTLAVGALGEASSASGIDGNQSDDSLRDSGAVYLFQ